MENSKQQQAVRVGNSYWIKVVAIFFIGWILMYATRTIFNPIMGVVGEQFGLSNTQLGLANSIFFLTYAIAQIPFGIIGDKIGRKMIITVGFLLLAVATYFSGLATTFVLFLRLQELDKGLTMDHNLRYLLKQSPKVNERLEMPLLIAAWLLVLLGVICYPVN